MADDSTITDDQQLVIPDDVAEKFTELVELIQGSKSMNLEERQYWVDVLPIMSQEQLQNLRTILENEKKQLSEASKTYSDGVKQAEEEAKRAFDEVAYLEKKRVREEAEAKHEAKEKQMEEDVLAELAEL